MKKFLLTCGLAIAVAVPAFAGPQGHDPARHAERLQERLQLDAAQTEQVRSILNDASTQRQALADKYKISERDAFRDEVRSLHTTTHGKIESLLTDEQKATLAEHRAERKEQFKKHHKERHHDKRHGQAKSA